MQMVGGVETNDGGRQGPDGKGSGMKGSDLWKERSYQKDTRTAG